jgi:hypothetical protein
MSVVMPPVRFSNWGACVVSNDYERPMPSAAFISGAALRLAINSKGRTHIQELQGRVPQDAAMRTLWRCRDSGVESVSLNARTRSRTAALFKRLSSRKKHQLNGLTSDMKALA